MLFGLGRLLTDTQILSDLLLSVDIWQFAVAAVANSQQMLLTRGRYAVWFWGTILALLNWLLCVWGAGGVGCHIAVSRAGLTAE